MDARALLSNPFAQMMAPEDLFRALKQAESLHRLASRVHRPLDFDGDDADPPDADRRSGLAADRRRAGRER